MVRGLGNRMIGGLGADDFLLADASFASPNNNVFGYNRVIDFNTQQGDRLLINLPGLQHQDLSISRFGQGARISLSQHKADEFDLASRHLGVVSGISAADLRDDNSSINPSLIAINEPFADSSVIGSMALANQFNDDLNHK